MSLTHIIMTHYLKYKAILQITRRRRTWQHIEFQKHLHRNYNTMQNRMRLSVHEHSTKMLLTNK